MTKYWIGSVNAENYKIVRDKSIWGVNSSFENSLKKASKGDKIVFYIHGKKLGGAFKIDSEVYHKTGVFKGGSYPYVVDLKPVKVPNKKVEKLPDFTDDLISDLKFIENKTHWSAYFRRPMLEIPEEDFEKLKVFL